MKRPRLDSLDIKRSGGSQLRQCPRLLGANGTVIVSSVFCSFGCCPGTGEDLWKCCTDPYLINHPAMEEWNWCTIFLLIILCVIITILLVGGTCGIALYLKRRDAPTRHAHPRDIVDDVYPGEFDHYPYGPGPGYFGQDISPPALGLPPLQRSSASAGMVPCSSATSNPWASLTPQQQYAMAMYWQMMYANYMKNVAGRKAGAPQQNEGEGVSKADGDRQKESRL